MPHSGGDVGTHVGVELDVFDRAIGEVVVVPAAFGTLRVDQPFVGSLGVRVHARDVERHRGFDVIPWVAMAANKPRNHSGGQLQIGD